nr:3-deoxy-D-manno-octulosonic acid transferase [uncultured Roseateles sp.]
MSSWRRRLSRGAYSGLLQLAQPAYVLRLWLRGREEPLYRHAIGERFGRYGTLPAGQGWLWIHAVSLGETRAATALIAALRAHRPGLRLLLTHGTATGREAGRTLLCEGDSQAWLPYDSPGSVRRFLRHFRPALGVMMETEVWPNLLRAARQARVPMALANARLSEKSRKQGQRLDAILRPAVQSFALVLAQTEADAQRLRERGAAPVEVAGNLKFDVTPDPALLDRGRLWREHLDRPVLLAAVTREGEEAQLLAAWQAHAWPQGERRPLLLLVPRHPQRFAEVAELVAVQGLTLARRSGFADAPDAGALAADAWLGDSMGEMALYYGLADVALLGGSFAPLGGQNLIEAAACACPVVMGPHTFNFAEAAELSQQAGAAFRVGDMAAGLDKALALLREPASQAAAGHAGLAFADQHRGAAERMAQRLLTLLP